MTDEQFDEIKNQLSAIALWLFNIWLVFNIGLVMAMFFMGKIK